MTDTTNDPLGAKPVDLTNCDREPIHLLGRVQSYGALLALSSDWIVQHASRNLGEILGVPCEEALGRPLSDLIVSDGFDRIRTNLRSLEVQDGSVRLFAVTLRSNGKEFDVSLHQSGAHLVIEFEPKMATRGRDVMADVYPVIASIRRDGTIEQLAADAARGLQAICGFDSVMVYQFQQDHSGKVIAEQRLDGRKRYNGMMFPASDIPVQARALYKRSLLRLIADVNDPGSPIHPGSTSSGQPIDLSLAVTRSVSPIHLEYLRNMGVQASMSVSIMRDGELWGLFACHHNTPRYIDYERRTAVEMFAHLFSYELSRHEDVKRKRAEADANRMQTVLMAHMANGRALSDSLLAISHDLKDVIPHDGLVLYENETCHFAGDTPTEEQFRSIARMLDRSIGSSVFATDTLGALHEPATEYATIAAGLMAIPISKRPRDYLVLLRQQVEDTVHWAGDPNKPVTVGPNGTRLTPRKSFEVWRETVLGRARPWTPEERHAAELLRTILLEVFLKVTDAAYLERKRAQEQQALLISELNHRVRNILNLMRGLLAQSRSSAKTLEDFTANLDGRIHALARAHDQLTSEQWEPASLRALISCEFDAYADEKSRRVTIDGPDVMIVPGAYTTLALVLHEMATNSVKYGALCDQAGRVAITLRMDGSGGLLIDWVERGGPPVAPPQRRGFGSVIIESSIPHELKGDAEISYKLAGIEAHFRIPPRAIDQVIEHNGDQKGPAPIQATDPKAKDFALRGQGLVLEDTLIIAMDAAGILEDMGARDVHIASSVASAMTYLDGHEVDFAVLDVNLGDEQSVSVAERLHAQGVPFVLATGYGSAPDLLAAYPPCDVVQKPFSANSLQSALREAITKGRARR
ncbi:HWE histidine kinase domain-containing protein [Pseudoprimorskyibacter insulae]|uniref:histidine kinase n=1 Tax=Pseudoprimorskyibacter insulae TaxID=1695997 RepID=A0A2R8AQ60_9RHOB|nr:HWE histidine kinase domain-containing protein [Pseudoprimorskyibacter insulae]SPF78173.1 Bacteriophytochrome [Pseudoprimorskyibacter insulae]